LKLFWVTNIISVIYLGPYLQPKSATKGDFYDIFLSLIVSSQHHRLQMANKVNKVLLGKQPC